MKKLIAVLAAGLLALALAAGGSQVIAKTGPSAEEKAADEAASKAAAEQQAAAARAAECQAQLGGLIAAEEDLGARLGGVGVTYEEYGRRVGDISAAYNAVPINQLQAACVAQVGFFAESALNNYINAGNTWNECFADIYCDPDSIDPELQSAWAKASTNVDAATRGMAELGQP
jgi:hypothetical protein